MAMNIMLKDNLGDKRRAKAPMSEQLALRLEREKLCSRIAENPRNPLQDISLMYMTLINPELVQEAIERHRIEKVSMEPKRGTS